MSQSSEQKTLRVILHAPTANALERARNNAANLLRGDPDANVRVIANAQAVAAALDASHEELDPITWVCPNTLAKTNRENREPLRVLSGPAVLEIARMQQEGWVYIRA